MSKPKQQMQDRHDTYHEGREDALYERGHKEGWRAGYDEGLKDGFKRGAEAERERLVRARAQEDEP